MVFPSSDPIPVRFRAPPQLNVVVLRLVRFYSFGAVCVLFGRACKNVFGSERSSTSKILGRLLGLLVSSSESEFEVCHT